ncbi:glycosyltransferase family 2 protein [Desulfobulbus alkaliphilus]|uniref:glycosyltransferase family 2 protein n=1 Tax=Desulfobulbus alkaliphilus TaxID=869814 RepID=UPI0019626121|nr:glycosyltransferase [Desulfobulbus alkaliphilus]MBM9538214.1 glycosyltransferase [Desulfobulbus alkaliphilus]
MKPKVSVIIPAYNHERFIGAAIESVLRQSHDNLELIIIDDGSTDNTAAVIKAVDDPRLTYLYQENQDAYNTINRGLSLAGGEYVAILNSDDVYTTDRLEKLLAAREETGAHCLITDVIPIDDDGQVFTDPDFGWNIWHHKNRGFYFSCGDLYTAFLKGNFMVTTSNFFLTREAVARVGAFCSLRYLHDYDYIFRVMLAFPEQVVYLHDQRLLYYRIHSGNTLSEAAVIGREQDKEVIRKYMLARVPEELKGVVAAGSERLVELEQELHQVRAALHPQPQPGIRQQARGLCRALFTRLFR